MLDVPSSFSAPQQKKVLKNTKREPSQNSHGLTSIIANPLIPADQAWAICRPKARLVAQDVGSQERSHIQGGRGRNCRVTDNVLGAKVTFRQGSNFPGLIPLMLGIDQGSQAKKLIVRAYNAALDSCLAQYGWSD
jgi:hypothetical protein